MEDKKTCSNCKREIKATTFELHESHCRRHIQLCEICEEPIPIKEMAQHFQENHAPIPCDLCGVQVAVDELEDHKEQSCLEAKVECKYCELDIRRGDYQEHVEQCGSRTDFCELCNQRVMLKDMSEHKEMKCGHMKSESPLRQSDLRDMGLVEDLGNGSESDDDFYDDYPLHGNDLANHSVTPPPPYERSHDNSMHVDPYWLQTVAEACGEESLDALLAQNMFFENMRNVRGREPVTNDDIGSHDSHVTTDESSDDVHVAVGDREEPSYHQQPPTEVDNHFLDDDRDRDLAKQTVHDEEDDFHFAQRLQEREVMGHSRMLYDEQISTDFGRKQREESQFSKEERTVSTVEQNYEENEKYYEKKEEELQLERERLLQQIQEIKEKEAAAREKENELAKRLEEAKEETESLKLAVELQKKDLAEGHRALWKKSKESRLCSSGEASVRKVDSSDKIPCQWCHKLIPFEQVMLHQQSCFDDYYGGKTPHGDGRQGLHLSEDLFRRVEEEEEKSWEVEEFNVECQYCHVNVSISCLATHEALCDSNPDIHLKKAYESRLLSSAGSEPRQELPSLSFPPAHSSTSPLAASAKLLSVEKGPCEYCQQVIPLSELIKHEARCSLTQHKYSPAPPPSSPTMTRKSETASDVNAGRRGLAIKFPVKDPGSRGEGDLLADKGKLKQNHAQMSKPVVLSAVASQHEAAGKKRHSPSDELEPWAAVGEPVMKASRRAPPITTKPSNQYDDEGLGKMAAIGEEEGSVSLHTHSTERGNMDNNNGEVRAKPLHIRGSRSKTYSSGASISDGMTKLSLQNNQQDRRKLAIPQSVSRTKTVGSSSSIVQNTKSDSTTGSVKTKVTSGARVPSSMTVSSRPARGTGRGTKAAGGERERAHSSRSSERVTLSSSRQTDAFKRTVQAKQQHSVSQEN